jgi:hypothetical protein
MSEEIRAGMLIEDWGPEPITQEEIDLWFGAMDRIAQILRTYYKAHGAPETRGEISLQAAQLCRELYPPGFPRPPA